MPTITILRPHRHTSRPARGAEITCAAAVGRASIPETKAVSPIPRCTKSARITLIDVEPAKNTVIVAVPKVNVRIRRSRGSTIGSPPRTCSLCSHIHHRPTKAKPTGRSHHVHGIVAAVTNGSMIPTIATESKTAPTGSSLRHRRPRLAASIGSRGIHLSASRNTVAATGTLNPRVARQPIDAGSSSRNTPPTVGPIATATPTVAPKIPNAFALSLPR